MATLPNVIKTADTYANQRAFQLSKGNNRVKLGLREMKEEISLASVFGELSALERIMTVILNDKEMTRNDIEAELHIAIVQYYKYVSEKLGGFAPISLERYLDMRGYYDKSSKIAAAAESHLVQ
jgi:hypothetical protein